jgi:hypothetical protein
MFLIADDAVPASASSARRRAHRSGQSCQHSRQRDAHVARFNEPIGSPAGCSSRYSQMPSDDVSTPTASGGPRSPQERSVTPLAGADLDLTNRETVAVDNAKIGFSSRGPLQRTPKLEALFSCRRQPNGAAFHSLPITTVRRDPYTPPPSRFRSRNHRYRHRWWWLFGVIGPTATEDLSCGRLGAGGVCPMVDAGQPANISTMFAWGPPAIGDFMTRSRQSCCRCLGPTTVRSEGRVAEGSLAPHVYLVGEAPGRQEAEAGRPSVALREKELWRQMREAGMGSANCLANALPSVRSKDPRSMDSAPVTNREGTSTTARSCLLISLMFGRS